MKKKIILSLFLFLLSFSFVPINVYAGPECTDAGGTCRAAKVSCNNGESSIGQVDCPGVGAGGQKCCVPNEINQTVPKFGDIQDKAGLPTLSTLSVGSIITKILPYVFGAVGLLLLVYLVLGGFQLMVSRGDPKAIASAQVKITNALVGFIITLVSGGIVIMLGKILGVDVLSNSIF